MELNSNEPMSLTEIYEVIGCLNTIRFHEVEDSYQKHECIIDAVMAFVYGILVYNKTQIFCYNQ